MRGAPAAGMLGVIRTAPSREQATPPNSAGIDRPMSKGRAT
jgi:hypothetical protein